VGKINGFLQRALGNRMPPVAVAPAPPANPDGSPAHARALEYRKKAARLRHIHSLKLTRYRRLANFTTALLVALSATVTFFGFSGLTRLRSYARWLIPHISATGTEFMFNVLLLLVVVLVILDLVYRFGERASAHNHAVVMLANFVNDLDDRLEGAPSDEAMEELLRVIAARYEVMTEFLPPNTDKEYHRSKRLDKKGPDLDLGTIQDAWTNEALLQQRLNAILEASSSRIEVLRAVREERPDAVIAGGFIRDPVWDTLSGFKVPTESGDVDVLYFDIASDRDAEADLTARLRVRAPNINWQVRNQARVQNGSPGAPMCLVQALQEAPETVSSIGVRLLGNDCLEVLAPCGLEDLFRMIVRPRPGASTHELERFAHRRSEKRWSEVWRDVVIVGRD
jgi:hypothetical protein